MPTAPTRLVCRHCGGRGVYRPLSDAKCVACAGAGYIDYYPPHITTNTTRTDFTISRAAKERLR